MARKNTYNSTRQKVDAIFAEFEENVFDVIEKECEELKDKLLQKDREISILKIKLENLDQKHKEEIHELNISSRLAVSDARQLLVNYIQKRELEDKRKEINEVIQIEK